jgi:predicted transcriptional regulator
MRIAKISIASVDEFMAHTLAAVRSGKPQKERKRFSYATPELLFETFTTPRWFIIRVMTGAEPMSIRELARRLGRDIKGVHRDVTALIKAGLIEHDETGAIVFPYDAVHVDFTLKTEDLVFPVVEQKAAVPVPKPRTPSLRSPGRPATARRKPAAARATQRGAR